MFEKIIYLLTNVFYSLINSIYIGLLVYAYLYSPNKPTTDHLIEKIKSLEYKQALLHQVIQKIRNIITIDDSLQQEQTEQLKKIQKEIKSIKQILNSNRLNSESDSDVQVSDSELEDFIPFLKNNPSLPLQNHITFPNFFIINEKNFKQTKLTDDTYELKMI
jgi:uncharacterized phage infection (PIP) family protein YhgE